MREKWWSGLVKALFVEASRDEINRRTTHVDAAIAGPQDAGSIPAASIISRFTLAVSRLILCTYVKSLAMQHFALIGYVR